MSAKIITDDSFETDVIGSPVPVIVDFWAEWCGPCKQMSPHLDSLAAEANGEFVIAKMDVDENPVTAGEFGLRGVPTLMLFAKGKMLASHTGAMSKEHILRWFAEKSGQVD